MDIYYDVRWEALMANFFVVLCDFGHNIRKILAHIRSLFAWIFLHPEHKGW